MCADWDFPVKRDGKESLLIKNIRMETCLDRLFRSKEKKKKKRKKERKIWRPPFLREAILEKDYSRLEQRARKVVRPCIHLNDLSP